MIEIATAGFARILRNLRRKLVWVKRMNSPSNAGEPHGLALVQAGDVRFGRQVEVEPFVGEAPVRGRHRENGGGVDVVPAEMVADERHRRGVAGEEVEPYAVQEDRQLDVRLVRPR